MEQKAKLVGSILGCVAGFIVAVLLCRYSLIYYHENITPLTGYVRGLFFGVFIAVTFRQAIDTIEDRIKQFKLNSPF